jgi:hypothetical protein
VRSEAGCQASLPAAVVQAHLCVPFSCPSAYRNGSRLFLGRRSQSSCREVCHTGQWPKVEMFPGMAFSVCCMPFDESDRLKVCDKAYSAIGQTTMPVKDANQQQLWPDGTRQT